LITASSDGVGFNIAKQLSEQGATVHIMSRKKKNIKEAVRKLKQLGNDVQGHCCNITKSEERSELIEMIKNQHGGRLDLLIINSSSSSNSGGGS
jgi:Tropinone reductase 1